MLSPGSLSPPTCLRPSSPDALANNTFIFTHALRHEQRHGKGLKSSFLSNKHTTNPKD